MKRGDTAENAADYLRQFHPVDKSLHGSESQFPQVKLITHARVLIGSTDQEENTSISFSPRLEGTTERHSRHVSLMSCRS